MELSYGDLYIGKEIYYKNIQCFIYAVHWDRSCLGNTDNVRIGLMNVEKVDRLQNIPIDSGIRYWKDLKQDCGRLSSIDFISKT